MATAEGRSQEADAFATSGHCIASEQAKGDVDRQTLPVCFPAAQRVSVKFFTLAPPPTVADLPSLAIETEFNWGR
jgi:hypothetical protein